MSLVEVAIAVGLVSFALVSIMGLFPTLLKTVKDSREKSLTQRMYQTVAEDIRENPLTNGDTRAYAFDLEGFLLEIDPPRPGQTFREGETRYVASADTSATASIPGGHTSVATTLSRIEVTDTVQNATLLNRPLWTTSDE